MSVTSQSVECRAMGGPERIDAFTLMRNFRTDDRRLNDALSLYVEREDYGFVWLAYVADTLVGCCTVGYAISTAGGGLAALVRDLYVVPAARRNGIATGMLAALEARLAGLTIARIEIPADNPLSAVFLAARGYAPADGRIFIRDR